MNVVTCPTVYYYYLFFALSQSKRSILSRALPFPLDQSTRPNAGENTYFFWSMPCPLPPFLSTSFIPLFHPALPLLTLFTIIFFAHLLFLFVLSFLICPCQPPPLPPLLCPSLIQASLKTPCRLTVTIIHPLVPLVMTIISNFSFFAFPASVVNRTSNIETTKIALQPISPLVLHLYILSSTSFMSLLLLYLLDHLPF